MKNMRETGGNCVKFLLRIRKFALQITFPLLYSSLLNLTFMALQRHLFGNNRK